MALLLAKTSLLDLWNYYFNGMQLKPFTPADKQASNKADRQAHRQTGSQRPTIEGRVSLYRWKRRKEGSLAKKTQNYWKTTTETQKRRRRPGTQKHRRNWFTAERTDGSPDETYSRTGPLSGTAGVVAPESSDRWLTVCVDGVLRAGRGGGLGAVPAGTVKGVPAAPRGVRIQRTQRQRQLIPGRARLRERERGRGHGVLQKI